MADDITTSHHKSRRRYEIFVGDELAGYLDYRDHDGAVEMYHTVTEPEFGGRGLASRLAGFALTDVRDSGLKVVPTCSFVRGFIDRHQEFADLVA
ncbi:N-acetyltransferase [Tessaracoccus sp. HDW20]|uniref:GNAT family N-acetyltransferase n=1 Tax=Tessaracoccus coleopterorum TaxID=2714950 RepID=UPI0018D3AF73|nr:GNAT family N-acetyltransferase [Tessaracoccus coleopterorum]NHB83660.1 N-acetyltransferase [Tessaracoccus coleopterorum]